ncbi:MAG: D-alanyl-D-alanine carboxypeptidase, partial [Pseudomonadota bacterium]|nr:D-alanyl-D-alanine carboxypeptidase [Pseudomonadota bacterium]
QYYPLFAEREFAFDGRAPQNTRNRNPLLGLGIGADGLKTGHTQEAGYGLVDSSMQGDRRIVFVVSGLDSTKARAEEAEAIVNWSFRQFVLRDVAKEGAVIAEADVWMGAAPRVGLTPAADISALLPALGGDAMQAEVVYKGPIEAPIRQGQVLAELILKPEGLEEVSYPLVADKDVPVGGFVTRVGTAAKALLRRLEQGPEGAS